MAKITALAELTAPADTDYMVIVDESTATTKKMELQYLLAALDGDHLDIDFTPVNYTPSTAPAEADDADDLAAHLQGIDDRLVGSTLEAADTSYTVSSTAEYIDLDTSGGAITATLGSAATLGAGKRYIFKVTDATNLVTINPNGAETIDGVSSWQLSKKNEVFEIISDGTNWKMLRWRLPYSFANAKFTYADATSYTVSSACYALPSSAFGKVYWTSTLTMGPDTWAAGSTAIATTGWHYLYLDQSAIDAGTSPIIADSHFLSSTTAPSWSDSYQGWYNGTDRCIFAVRFATASTLLKFFHDGSNLVQFDDHISVYSGVPTTNWSTGVVFSVPSFCSKAKATFVTYPSTSAVQQTFVAWRQGDSSATTGHIVGQHQYYTGTASHWRSVTVATTEVDLGATYNIDVMNVTVAYSGLYVYHNGFYLPYGFDPGGGGGG